MKKHLLLFVLVLGSIGAMAQAFGWTELRSDSSALNANGTIRSICTDAAGEVYAAGWFTNATGKYYIAKWDGIKWSELGNYDNGLNENYSIPSICTDGFNIYAVSSLNDSANYVAKFFSISWERLPSLTDCGILYPPNFSHICIDALGNLYAGGSLFDSSYSCVAKWNTNSTWHRLPIAIMNYIIGGDIYTMCTGGLGYVYVAGSGFYDTTNHNGVVKWDGINWSLLGAINPINSNAIASLCTDALGHVYAGGGFTNASGKNYVAIWDGLHWSELGGSNALNVSGSINSMCIDALGTGNLYAAGYFTDTSGSNYVAKWDGMNWSELGSGSNALKANGVINSICTDATGIILPKIRTAS